MKSYGSGLIAKIVSSLTTPAAGTRHLQPKSDGWYDIDSAGAVVGPLTAMPARLQSAHSNDVPGGDWNNATDTGWYEGLSTATNTPFGAAHSFLGHVIRNDVNWIVQTLYDFTVNDVDHAVYTRRRSSGTWGPWRRLGMGLFGSGGATNSFVAYVTRRGGHLRIETTTYLGTRLQRLPLLRRSTGNFYLGAVVDEGVEGQAPLLSAASIAVISTDYIGITLTFNPNGAANTDIYTYWRWEDFHDG